MSVNVILVRIAYGSNDGSRAVPNPSLFAHTRCTATTCSKASEYDQDMPQT